MTKKKEVATSTAEQLPAHLQEQSSRGQENVTTDDLSIPRLDVIQALSPQRKKTDPAYIEGAEEGMLFNSVTQQLYGEAITFVPVFFRKEWLVWKDRDAGGGFNGAFAIKAEAEALAAELGDDYQAVETAQHFGMIVGDGALEEVVISMSRSKMKASRQLNTLAKMIGGDRFASTYEVKAIEVNGEKGDYFSLGINRTGYVDEETYHAAEKCYEAVSGGEKNVKYGDEE